MKTDYILYKLFSEKYYSELPDWYIKLTQGTKMKRKHMSKSHSKKSFRKGMKTQRKNITPAPTRGGYRL